MAAIAGLDYVRGGADGELAAHWRLGSPLVVLDGLLWGERTG